MPPSELSFHVVAGIAKAVVRAPDLQSAFHVVIDEVFRVLRTRAIIFEKREAGWLLVAGIPGRDLRSGLDALPSDGALLLLNDPVAGQATAVSLAGHGGPPVALVLDGDWTAAHNAMTTWGLVVSFALHSVRERDAKHHAEHLLVDGYAMARRLSRLGDVDRVGQRIVEHVARMLNAERVSMALYRPTEDCLVIAAASGYPLSAVEDVRIQPGSWVIGHVYSSGRPVFVRDVRLVRGMARDRDDYRTFSFAAVPMFAGSETVGVLTVTDKRDGSAFGRQDEMVLRTLSVAAAVALVAARADTEVSRLAYAATIDSLTGLLNRPYLDTRLHQEVERSKREASVLAVLMADIDDFKTINDTRGHQVGDAVLQTVGSIIRSAVRVFDVCVRYGGDEFAILMPNSDHKSAVACAERIRLRIAEYQGEEPRGANLPRLTMSIGVAVIEPGDTAPDLILRADRCLYQAKADGKNLVRTQASGPTASPVPRSGRNETEPGLTSRLIETGVWDRPASRADEQAPRVDLPYVLVADAHPERAALCLEAVKPFKVGLLIARDGDQAARLLERFGPPILLVVDLSLSSKDGFAVIEMLRSNDRARTEIIAWSASRELREFAASRLGGLNVRVLGSGSAPSIMRAAIERALERHANAPAPSDAASALTPEELHQTIADLAGRVRQVCGTPGVAIYLRAPGSTQFRASFTWTSDDAIPHSPYYLPRVFDRIQETGEAMILPDLATNPLTDAPSATVQDAVQGLVAVPAIGANDEIIGAICVFDVKPLTLDDINVSALKALGRSVFTGEGAAKADPVTAREPVWTDHESLVTERVDFRPLFRDRAGDQAREPGTAATLMGQRRARRSAAAPTVDWPPALLDRIGGEFAVARELARARRERGQLSVVLFDISPAGRTETKLAASLTDDLLESVADTLLKAIRQSDLPIRWSGNELLVVLPGLAGAEARSVAERVRAALQAGSSHRVAVSGGVAELEAEERFGAVVDRARQKVGLAVGRGHNRVI